MPAAKEVAVTMTASQDTRSASEHIRALKDFAKRVARISEYEVPRMVREGRLASTVQVALGDPLAVNCVHPTDEQIDAFVLNLRLFIQSGECGGENISFRRMASSFATLPLSADIKAEFARLRDDLNRWLDSKSPLGFGGEPLLNRRILEVFVYGDLAHINSAEKRSTHESWAAALCFYPLLKTQFVFVIGKSMDFLCSGSALCERALTELETAAPSSS